MSATRARLRIPRPRRVPHPKALAGLLGVLIVLAGGWLWVRDSSLVAVTQVRVLGAHGPDARQIATALSQASRSMTTLDVRIDRLRTAVAPYPVVKGLRASTQFPHGLTIRVIEQEPVAVIAVAGHRIAVGGDGTLLRDVAATAGLPRIQLRLPPAGERLTGSPLTEVRMLAAAPRGLLGRVSQVSTAPVHGIVAQLRDGPSIYFGDASAPGAKWAAASAVLADSRSAGAVYIDVSDPRRPAAGTGSDGAPSPPAAGPATSTAGAGTTSTSG